jgi:hypothetical protein
MVDLGIPELTTEQTEFLCQTAEEAAKNSVLSKVSVKDLDKLDIAVEVVGTKPVEVTVEIDLILGKSVKAIDAETLVKDAVREAHKAAEKFLRQLK